MQEHEVAITGHATEVRVEGVSWRDLRAVAEIQRASFRAGLAYGLGALAFLYFTPGVVFLVARTPASRVAGCVIADVYRGNSRIMNIAVAPSERRKGVATALMREIESRLHTGNMVLMAEEWNTGAQELYLREGYVRDGVAANYYGRGRNGIWMKKQRTPIHHIRI